MKWWQKILANAIIFISLAGLFDGFYVGSIWVALGASVILGFLNLFVKPFLFFLSLPITILTFGLFSVVINAIMLNLTSFFIGSGFAFASFGTSILVAVCMSLINAVLNTPRVE